MKFFGIDLGTSKCAVAYAVSSSRPSVIPQATMVNFRVDLRVDPLGTKSPVVPSVVARSEPWGQGQGTMLFGFEAEYAVSIGHVRGTSCRDVFRSVKSHLGTGRSYVRADAAMNTPIKVWAGLIRRLCEMTVAEKGADFDPRQHPTVLTVPASFGKAQRDDTKEAARLAGFNVAKQADLVHLIDEPVAALIDTLNHPDIDLHVNPDSWNTVLVFDFGGGTCDLTLLKFRYDASKPTGIAIQPQAISPYQQIGGDTVDLAIMHKIVWPQVCHQNGLERRLTATERKHVEDRLRYTVCRRLKERLNERLKTLTPGEPNLSRVSEELGLSGVGCFVGDREVGGSAKLSADDLRQVYLPFIDPCPNSRPFSVGESSQCFTFAKLIETTMERAGLTADRLDLLVLHGGSCHSPFVREAFEHMKETGFLARSCKIIETPDLITSVARGAALFGCLSKKLGKPYIQPIVPEDMSVLTVGNVCEPLVTAGAGLPYKKTFEKFYLSKKGQHQIVVPIYIGHDLNKEGRLASTLTIAPIPPGLPQSHQVEVELEIDVDKDSHWRFRPKGYDWSKAYEVANPWIGQEATEAVIKLQETRKRIRVLVDGDQKPPVQLLAEEAFQAARAGYSEEGLALIEELLSANPGHVNAWNYKGLVHSQRGEYQQSLECHEQAATLEPNDMVIRGNCGAALVYLKRYEEAVVAMRKALSTNPSLTYLHSWLAEAFQALGNTAEMNKELEKWYGHAQRQTVQRPEEKSAWEELRRVAIRLGRYQDADDASASIRGLTRHENLLAGAKHG